MKQELTIAIFCWNTQSVRYRKLKKDLEIKIYQQENILTKINSYHPNNINKLPESEKLEADFIEDIINEITINEPDIIAIMLQEDSIKDSPIIELIKENIDYYSQLDFIEMSGWGSTTYKALKNNMEYLPRGLRLLLLKNNELKLHIESSSYSYVCPSIRDSITWGKGCVAIKLNIENIGEILIANMHLPFSSESLKIKSRKECLDWQITCFNYLYKNLENICKNIIIAGDLNFRVNINADIMLKNIENKELLSVYNNHDEFRQNIDLGNITHVYEGKNNMGISFIPTCKLNQGREVNSYSFNIGKEGQRTPSWCDRIIYSLPNNNTISCDEYKRFEAGNMVYSDHAAIIGRYNFRGN